MSKNKIYYFPEGVLNISELLDSEGFKKFANEHKPSVAVYEALGSIRTSGQLEDMTTAIIGEHKAGQSIIVKYLKSLKTDKNYKYNFLRAYEGFSKNSK